MTGSNGAKTFYNISDTARATLVRRLLGVKQLTSAVKSSTNFEELWDKDPVRLFIDENEIIPEPTERLKYRQAIVAERLTGLSAEPDDRFITHDMKWGIVNERLAISKYQLITENIVQEAPFLLHPTLRAGASPDGFVIERKTGLLGVLEAKNLRTANHLYNIIMNDVVPDEYMVQIHMEIWISGRDFCDFVGYDSRLPNGVDIFIKRVWRDDNYIDNVLEPTIIRFLEECKRDEDFFRKKIVEAKEKYGKE